MAKVVILSGAGISAESGISTFRDSDGLWEEYDVKDICTAGCLKTNRDQTIEFYDNRRLDLENKQPNKAHKVLAELKAQYKDDIAIITQNVDNLFEKAGMTHEDVTHLHGYLTAIECEECAAVYDIGNKKVEDSFNGKCPTCNSKKIRPNIVMFGELVPMYDKLYQELKNCELLVVIGTSGNVISVDNLAVHVDKSILNNLEPSEAIFDELYSKVLYKKASEAIDEILLDIKNILKKDNDIIIASGKSKYQRYSLFRILVKNPIKTIQSNAKTQFVECSELKSCNLKTIHSFQFFHLSFSNSILFCSSSKA